MARTRSPVALPLLLAVFFLLSFHLFDKLTRPPAPAFHFQRGKRPALGFLESCRAGCLPIMPHAFAAHDSTMTATTITQITTAPNMSSSISILYRPRLWPPGGGRVCGYALSCSQSA